MEHAGDVRRGVASICDMSFDLISISGKVDVGSNSILAQNKISSKVDFLRVI